ncbi:hypothetical protein H2203_005670 [Taxawa tesnikishii (nom. ined.)]|nr:hypothetical protein H2203_005670 [Dothideales sp. JES 119]
MAPSPREGAISQMSSTNSASSSSASASSSSQPPGWHFPGPSSRYHKREKPFLLQDSPFSDYFSDVTRSVDRKQPQYALPTPETQKLLLRLNNLGSEILRCDPTAVAAEELSGKLDALEAALTAPQTQSRQPVELADSGLFMDEPSPEEQPSPEEVTPSKSRESSLPFLLDGAADEPDEPDEEVEESPEEEVQDTTPKKKKIDDRLLKEACSVMKRVSRANESLRRRYEEVRRLNDQRILQMEDSAQEVLSLKSENESLKADLGFDHSELLFLKLQLKALEVQVDGLFDRDHDANADVDDEQYRRKILLVDDLDRWKADWDDVDARLRRRREKHGIVSSTPEKLAKARNSERKDDEGDWKLDMTRKRHGRVQSITIKRLSTVAMMDGADGDVDADEETLVEESVGMGMQERRAQYAEQATQTEEVESEAVVEEKHAPEDSDEEEVQFVYDNDEDEMEDDRHDYQEEEDEDEEDISPLPSPRTPWQELCDSLVSWAGMDRMD